MNNKKIYTFFVPDNIGGECHLPGTSLIDTRIRPTRVFTTEFYKTRAYTVLVNYIDNCAKLLLIIEIMHA